MADRPDRSDLERVLDRARHLGFLGPGPIRDQIGHAQRYLPPLDRLGPARLCDLGAGGGLPSLPVLVARPELRATLVDALQKRWAFLVWALVELGLDDRAEAWCGRAEDFGHDPERRGRYDVVVARGFGPPATTVECGAPLLRPGGRLVISEPPGGRRWPACGLARAGMELRSEAGSSDGVVVMERVVGMDETLPRSHREQQRAPLFEL